MTSIDLDDVLSFIFPSHIQHHLAAGRLYAYGSYGPLDDENNLRSGFKRSHILKEYELNNMCLQSDKEEVISVFAKKFEELSNAEQSMIVGQADARFKTAKGKAMMPALSKDDVKEIFTDVLRNDDGTMSFHDMQEAINIFRQTRIINFKLMYPPLGKVPSAPTISSSTRNNSAETISKIKRRDVENVVPASMFKKMEGLSNAEIIEQTAKNLNKHAFKISCIGEGDLTSSTSNIKLLRDIPPCLKSNVVKKGKLIKDWDETSNLKKVGMGSMVMATPSSTTWLRKHTLN
jgi:hypothetical protein